MLKSQVATKPQFLRFAAIGLIFSALTTTWAAPFAGKAGPADTVRKPFVDDFERRVAQYQALREDLESRLPPLRPTPDPAAILAHEKLLAQKVIEARKDAKRGDIFTDEISARFRRLLRKAFAGPNGPKVHKTIRQGEPLAFTLRVNQMYPAGVPVTTVPPTVLRQLPKLPMNLEYRIVGNDFVLEDIKSELVLDYIEGAAYPSALD